MFFLLSLPFKITIVIFHAFLFPPFFLLSLSSRPTACFSSTWILSLALLLTVSPLTLLPPSPLRSIGGSIPIVFSYYSEFLAQEKRGEHLSWLCMFWMIGGIYASAMAWAIIPHYGEKNKQIARSGNHCLRQYVYKSLNTLSSSHGCLHMAGMESKNILLTSLLYYSFFGTFNFTTLKKNIYSTGTVYLLLYRLPLLSKTCDQLNCCS